MRHLYSASDGYLFSCSFVILCVKCLIRSKKGVILISVEGLEERIPC
jgi:hypothetical protein